MRNKVNYDYGPDDSRAFPSDPVYDPYLVDKLPNSIKIKNPVNYGQENINKDDIRNVNDILVNYGLTIEDKKKLIESGITYDDKNCLTDDLVVIVRKGISFKLDELNLIIKNIILDVTIPKSDIVGRIVSEVEKYIPIDTKNVIERLNIIEPSIASISEAISEITSNISTSNNNISTIVNSIIALRTLIDNNSSNIDRVSGDILTHAEIINNLIAQGNSNSIKIDQNILSISNINSNILENINDIHALETEIASILNQISVIVSTNLNIQNQINELSDLITSIGSQYSTLSLNISNNNTSITNIFNTLDSFNTKFNTIFSNMESYSTRVQTLESYIPVINNAVVNISNLLQFENDTLLRLSSIDSKISEIFYDLSIHTDNIIIFQSQIASISNSIISINQAIANNNSILSGNISNINDTISNINQNILDINSSLYTNSTLISNINSSLSSLTNTVNTNSSKLVNLETRILSLETILSGADALVERVDNIDTFTLQLKHDLDVLTALVNSINPNDTSITTRISNIETQITSINNSIQSISADIEIFQEQEEAEDLVITNRIKILNYIYYSTYEAGDIVYVVKKNISDICILKRVEEVGTDVFDIRYSMTFRLDELPTKLSNLEAVGYYDLLLINI